MPRKAIALLFPVVVVLAGTWLAGPAPAQVPPPPPVHEDGAPDGSSVDLSDRDLADASSPIPFSAVAADVVLRGEEGGPRTEVRVTFDRALTAEGVVRVLGLDGSEHSRVAVGPADRGSTVRLPVPMPPADGVLAIDVRLDEGGEAFVRRLEVPAPDPDWVVHVVPGFHFEPVGWNTQSHDTETGRYLDAQIGPGLALVEEYLRSLEADPDQRVAFHQLPYLKAFVEARPWWRESLLEAVASGRAGIVGGTYNELSTTLVGIEAQIRNVVHGTLWQREVLGGPGDIFWQGDVHGHDPSFPGLMARVGHRAGVVGHGPFHPGGAPVGANFPTEFLWVSPDGRGVLTHATPGGHEDAYARLANGANRASDDRSRTRAAISLLFEERKEHALTHHILVPLHSDFVRPLENLGEVVRDWNEAYRSPRVEIDTSEGFFRAVEAEIAARGLVPPVITRDMNPARTGSGVSHSDLKIAERQVETMAREAEIFASIAAMEGAEYPASAIDRVWRQLLFNAHHDAVAGTISDQVAVDLLWGYRDALELARSIRFAAQCFLAQRVAGDDPLVWNSVARPRSGYWIAEETSDDRPSLFRGDLPALGVRRLSPEPAADETPEVAAERPTLVNEHLRVELDLSRGGTITSIVDRATGDELLFGPGNDVVLLDEYAVLPGRGGSSRHLAPTGARRPGTGVAARLIRPDARYPFRLEIEAEYPEFTKRQTIELLPGERRIDFRTTISSWRGRNQMLRVEFPLRHPGARPVFGTAAAAVGRPFARDVDTSSESWTLDQTAGTWFGLGRTAAVEVVTPDRGVVRRAIGVGEIIVGDAVPTERLEQANDLARALVRVGVTTTITREGARRYGDLAVDANVPDFRLLLGGPDELARVATLDRRSLSDDRAVRWYETTEDLPTLVVRPDEVGLDLVTASLERDRAIVIPAEAAEMLGAPSVADRGFALVNHGAVSSRVETDGTMAITLLRSPTGWPSGVWIDPPSRRHPDGSPLGSMHGTHHFRYSLIPHVGDHRDAGIAARAHEAQHPPVHQLFRAGDGTIEDGHSWVSVEPQGVLLTALKPAGYDHARWMPHEAGRPTGSFVARLWNGTGSDCVARVRLGFPVERVFVTDLLEVARTPLAPDEDGYTVEIPAQDFATLLLEVPVREGDPIRLDVPVEPNVPSSYWLENRGEGVNENGILSLTPRARRLVLGSDELDDGGIATELHISNGHRSRAATVPLTSRGPTGLEVTIDPPQVEVPPGGSVFVQVRVTPRDVWSGRAVIEIATAQPHGRVTTSIWVRDAGTPADTPSLAIEDVEPLVPPRGRMTAVVRNLTDGPLRGLASWVSPIAAWPGIARWQQEIDLSPQGAVEIESRLATSVESYALLRVVAAGEVYYGDTVALLGRQDEVILSFDVDRVRIAESGIGVANVTARSRGGLSEGSEITLAAPLGWRVEEIAREFEEENEPDGRERLVVSFAITLGDEAEQGTLVAIGPGGARATAETSIAPMQFARRTGGEIEIDGDLSDWEAGEFVVAAGELGEMRTAVRYQAGALVLAFDVVDETFRQPFADGRIGRADSVRFALTAAPGTEIGYSAADLEFGAALTERGPILWCWNAGRTGRTGRVEEAEVAVVPYAGGIRYELRIPRSRLAGIDLAPGANLGFGAIAPDDDGSGYRGAIEWTPGLEGEKDASQFGVLRLASD